MNLTRCENGHFFDAERFSECPHCNQGGVETVAHTEGGSSLYTTVLDNSEAITYPEDDPKDLVKTIGYFDDISTEPVVGWLVAVKGAHLGEDFKLKSGRNFIGRADDMDVSLKDDETVSRDKHAIIVYEPKCNIFLVQPGSARELFYLNDEVVLSAKEIKAYDKILLGKTTLLFIPCCSDKFNWDSVNSKEEKK